MAKVIIDAGHGGREPGAIYGDRKEKDDTLRLLRGRRMYTTARLRRHRPQIGRAEIF